MADLLASFLSGAEVEVRTTVLPPLRVSLAGLADGSPPGAVTRLLKPEVVVRRGSVELYRAAPVGAPPARAWVAVALSALLIGVLAVVLLRR